MNFIEKICTFIAAPACQQTARVQRFASEAKSRGWMTRFARRQAVMQKKSEVVRRKSLLEKYKNQVPLIDCKNKQLNHYKNVTYAKFVPLPLASNGWYHRRSAGDYFTIYSEPPKKEVNSKDKKDVPNLMRMEDFGFIDESEPKIEETTSFTDLKLSENLVKAVEKMGIKKPSQIQAQGISAILSGINVVLTAHTGCGKTLAFLLPIIEHILHYKKLNIRPKSALDSPFAIIISPSRELSAQTYSIAKAIANYVDIEPKLVVGGQTGKDIRSYDHSEIDILIGSLGAVSQFITRGVILPGYLRAVVLDEADTLLDENFSEKLIHLLKKKFMGRPRLNPDDPGVQLIMVGATMPVTLSEKLYSVIPVDSLHQITTEEVDDVLPGVKQKFIRVNKSMKPSLLLELVQKDMRRKESVIIFRWVGNIFERSSRVIVGGGFEGRHIHRRQAKNMMSRRFRVTTT